MLLTLGYKGGDNMKKRIGVLLIVFMRYYRRHTHAIKKAKLAGRFENIRERIEQLLDIEEQLGVKETDVFLASFLEQHDPVHSEEYSEEDIERLTREMARLSMEVIECMKKRVTEQVNELMKVGTMQSIEMAEETLKIHQGNNVREMLDVIKRNVMWIRDFYRLNARLEAAVVSIKAGKIMDDEAGSVYQRICNLQETLYVRPLSDCEVIFADLKEELNAVKRNQRKYS